MTIANIRGSWWYCKHEGINKNLYPHIMTGSLYFFVSNWNGIMGEDTEFYRFWPAIIEEVLLGETQNLRYFVHTSDNWGGIMGTQKLNNRSP